MERLFIFRIGLGTFNIGLVCTSIFISALLLSPVPQAEELPKINKFTIHRDRTPESYLSSPVSKEHKISNYTLHREKTPASATAKPRSVNIIDMEVDENSGVYRIKLSALIRAPARFVRKVLTDFQHLYRLNPSIIESEVLGRDENDLVMVRTRVIGCAAYFCDELERVEKVQLLPSGDILTEIIPEKSEFKFGKTYWQIKALGDACEVSYQSDIEPDIFIPPIIGGFLIKKSIKQEMEVTLVNLEIISNVLLARDNSNSIRTVDNCDSPVTVTASLCAKDINQNLSENK